MHPRVACELQPDRAMATHPRSGDTATNHAQSLESHKPRFAAIFGLVALAWLPLVLLSALASSDEVDPLLLRAEPHTRLLIALVVLLLAEPALDRRIGMVARSVSNDGSLRAFQRKQWKDTLQRVRRWRDAKLFEAGWLVLIYATLVLAYFDLLPDQVLRWLLSTLHGVQWTEATLAWWWYVLVAQPLLLLLIGRWLYRWVLWTILVGRLSRLEPDVRAVHGDGVGGFGVLRLPLDALPAFVFALGSAIASVWFDEIAAGKAEVSTFAGDLLGFLALCVGLLLLPYLVLTPSLVRARELGTIEYGELARRSAVEFEQRWIERAKQERADLLEHPDVSSLDDLRSVTDGVARMRVVVPNADDLEWLLIAAVLPFLAVVLAQAPSAVDVLQTAVLRFIGG